MDLPLLIKKLTANCTRLNMKKPKSFGKFTLYNSSLKLLKRVSYGNATPIAYKTSIVSKFKRRLPVN